MVTIAGKQDPEFATYMELLQWRAMQHGDRLAYTFLVDGETQETCLTYRELDQRVRSVAALLQKLTIKGDRVLLLYPPGLDYIVAFLGCLYAGVIAVPTYPPTARLERSLPRLQAITNDTQAAVALTTKAMLNNTEAFFKNIPDFRSLQWLTTDTLTNDLAAAWHDPGVDSNTLAFLQYTSGSTGLPKGVMVTNGNLLHNAMILQTTFNHTEQTRIVSWLPLYHDMGLIGNILQSLYVGSLTAFMSPVAFIQRPIRWLQAISRYKAYTSAGPNFAYDMCVRKITAEQCVNLDLSCWMVAGNGSEPIRYDTLAHFIEKFKPYGFRPESISPCYGLAETTLLVSGNLQNKDISCCYLNEAALTHNQIVPLPESQHDTRTFISCGYPHSEQHVIIADPETLRTCTPDQIGELWVSSSSVAMGYWNRNEETKRTFHAYLADTGEGPFLRTGDLGFFYNGQVYIAGRLKDLIIIRGRNIHPQDIETTAGSCHEALRPGCVAAFSTEIRGEERLIIVQEIERQHRHADLEEVIEIARQAIYENHDVQPYAVVLIKTGTLPKTSSGKIQRHLTREKYLARDLEIVGA